MNINNIKLKDVSEETLRSYLKSLDKPILGDDLKVSRYRNGDPIPQAVSDKQWIEFGEKGIGAYCITGKGDYLYSWYAVTDIRKLAPEGWRIPTDDEWDSLEEKLLKNPSYAGSRGYNFGSYYSMGNSGCFWSSTVFDDSNAWYRTLNYTNSEVFRYTNSKSYGFAIRCVKEKENE